MAWMRTGRSGQVHGELPAGDLQAPQSGGAELPLWGQGAGPAEGRHWGCGSCGLDAEGLAAPKQVGDMGGERNVEPLGEVEGHCSGQELQQGARDEGCQQGEVVLRQPDLVQASGPVCSAGARATRQHVPVVLHQCWAARAAWRAGLHPMTVKAVAGCQAARPHLHRPLDHRWGGGVDEDSTRDLWAPEDAARRPVELQPRDRSAP